jgi:hypothetical protein
MKCPKCGNVQEADFECDKCGIIFQKYLALKEKKLKEKDSGLPNKEQAALNDKPSSDKTVFNWIKKKSLEWSVKTFTKDIEDFLAQTKQIPDRDLPVVLISAAVTRLNLTKNGIFPKDLFENTQNYSLEDRSYIISHLISASKNCLKKGQNLNYIGFAIWIHSLRGIDVPEIRDYVLMMWRILSKGLPYIDEISNPSELFNIDNLPTEEIKYIPPMYRKT